MTTTATRTLLLHGYRAQLTRGELEIRSEALIDESAQIKRGADGDNDQIGGGAIFDGRAIAAALGVRYYLDEVVKEIHRYVAPTRPRADAPRHVGQALVQAYFGAAGRGRRLG
jgi:hypothetical protein